MNVQAVALTSRLQLRLLHGYENGNPILRTRTYSNIKTGAVDADVYGVAKELADLQVHDLEVVRRVNEVELIESE